jgi:hypothetical protein
MLSQQSTAARRRPPLPPAAKARYDAVFDANVKKQRQREQAANAKLKHSTLTPPRRAVGWRGVSVDLTTNGMEGLEGLEKVLADAVGSSALPDEERLPASVVRLIWSCSNLPKEALQKIWAECDSDRKGSLNKQEFCSSCQDGFPQTFGNRQGCTAIDRSVLITEDLGHFSLEYLY